MVICRTGVFLLVGLGMTATNGRMWKPTKSLWQSEGMVEVTLSGGRTNIGIIRRGAPKILILKALPITKTSARAPGPGPLREVDWMPIGSNYLANNRVICIRISPVHTSTNFLWWNTLEWFIRRERLVGNGSCHDILVQRPYAFQMGKQSMCWRERKPSMVYGNDWGLPWAHRMGRTFVG